MGLVAKVGVWSLKRGWDTDALKVAAGETSPVFVSRSLGCGRGRLLEFGVSGCVIWHVWRPHFVGVSAPKVGAIRS